MFATLRYLWFIVRHKWFVYLECRKVGVEFLQAIQHDMSKLGKAELQPYIDHFERHKTSPEHEREYRAAWLHHIARNPHHWEFWLLPNGTPQKIPDHFVREMVADWRGVGRALGKGSDNAARWYVDNQKRLILHPDTRDAVERLLGLLDK